ncbi:MAG: hypothetical protein FJ303_12720 [Planctomycetes bacterium]|nr:hypothetical protein [Planctomycetota bacterium]
MITLSQVRDAANALVSTRWFDADHRRHYLTRIAASLQRAQLRNQKARHSHYKTRRRQLHDLGFFSSRMSSCIPP